jgi:hypothetical protein
MKGREQLINELISKIEILGSNMKKEFSSVNTRLDKIDGELMKLNTIKI